MALDISETPQHHLWQACVDRLAKDMSEQQFNTWIRPLQAKVADDLTQVTILVGNRFKMDWIRSQYLSRLTQTLTSLAENDLTVELALLPRDVAATTGPTTGAKVLHTAPLPNPESVLNAADADDLFAVLPANHTATPIADAHHADDDRVQEAPVPYKSTLIVSPREVHHPRLNAELTFAHLVEGQPNRMARAAARHVAHSPGQMYNPLFIYGGVGLGKTHLAHAIGNQMLIDNPSAKILYVHTEQFVTDVVKSYQRKTFDEFKRRYHALDLLLIDDVQFLANKDRTQEEFFNAFEALLTKKSHIVMTSDTHPKGLTDIHERLVSRFESGLAVAIEPPGLDMRVAILMSKAESEAADVPEDVAFFVAKHVRSNVRELEGALRKILAFSRFNQRDISIQLAREALKDLLTIQTQLVSIEGIQKTVSDYYKIKVADMCSKKRPAHISKPRQIAMYLAKELTDKSLPDIGDVFGGRDHTTVLHAVRKIATERARCQDLNQELHILEQTIKG